MYPSQPKCSSAAQIRRLPIGHCGRGLSAERARWGDQQASTPSRAGRVTDRTLCVRPTAKPSVLLDPIWSPYSRGKPNGLPRAGTALRLSSGLPATPMSTSRRQPEERGGVGDERVWRNGRRGRLKILLLPREVALQPRPPVSHCTTAS